MAPRRWPCTSPSAASGRCGISRAACSSASWPPGTSPRRSAGGSSRSRSSAPGRTVRGRSSSSSRPTSSSTTSRCTRTPRITAVSSASASSTSSPTTPTARVATACSAPTATSTRSTTGSASTRSRSYARSSGNSAAGRFPTRCSTTSAASPARSCPSRSPRCWTGPSRRRCGRARERWRPPPASPSIGAAIAIPGRSCSPVIVLSRVDESDLLAREPKLDLASPEFLEEGSIDLSLRRADVDDADPGLDADLDARLRDLGDPDDGRRVLQHACVATHDVADRRQHLRQVRVVRNRDGQIALPHGAIVVEDLADDPPIRNDDARPVGMQERGREELDPRNVAAYGQELDVFADAEGLGEDDREAGHEVTEHSLQREADPEAGHADTGDQRRDLETELVERHHGGKEHDDDLEDADDQKPHRRLHLLLEPPIHELTDPSGHDRAGGQDDQGSDHLKPITDREVEDDVFHGHGRLLGLAQYAALVARV